jgi:hypothetical protein
MIESVLNQWVLQPQYLTAWLQAVAAIVALGISAWSVQRQGAAERRRYRQEMDTLAVAVYPEIAMLKITIQTVRERITKLKETNAGLTGQSIGATFQAASYIPIPPMLERNIDKLFILGDVAGPTCIQLSRLIIQYNATVETITQRILTLNADQWITAIQQVYEHLALLDKVVDKADHEVRPIHDRYRDERNKELTSRVDKGQRKICSARPKRQNRRCYSYWPNYAYASRPHRNGIPDPSPVAPVAWLDPRRRSCKE